MNSFKFKKNFGQHFLKDREILERISEIKDLKKKIVIEIGPGSGNLTEFILKKQPKKLILVEKDKSLEPYLKKFKMKNSSIIEVIFEDALNLKLNKLVSNKITLIGNLPYNVATTLIINWLKYIDAFESIVVMVQKEVADRLTAKVSSKDYGRLSVLVQLHSKIKKVLDIDPSKFHPKPKVFSSVVELIPKKKKGFNYLKIDQTLKLCFSQRRKTLRNNIKKHDVSLEKIELIESSGIDLNLRPQDLKIENYLKLSDILSS